MTDLQVSNSAENFVLIHINKISKVKQNYANLEKQVSCNA